ncbi:chorion class A protein Ld12-like [Galleria mellonella]|uniref:Chorion class A protein Ld12-like n=1 Tax=Galleria mellonella TaxID=7137 RepID=A0A6J3CC44_GALME|nr:chorion class A protein Ld12-like [Galleria mellonella]
MSTFAFLLLCIQACLIQNVYSQYLAKGGAREVAVEKTTVVDSVEVDRGYGLAKGAGWGPGYGYGPAGLGLAGANVGAIGVERVGLGPVGLGAVGLPPYGWEAEYGLGGAVIGAAGHGIAGAKIGAIGLPAPPVPVVNTGYGGVGNGVVEAFADLPVFGTALLGGQVPVLGAVEFAGILPATGAVSISGNCGCGLGYANKLY